MGAKSFIDRGDLVPDNVTVGLIASELNKLGDTPWLLDGFPRTQPQAEALQAETPVNVVVNLDVPFDTIIDRIKDRWIHPDLAECTTSSSTHQKSLERTMKLARISSNEMMTNPSLSEIGWKYSRPTPSPCWSTIGPRAS